MGTWSSDGTQRRDASLDLVWEGGVSTNFLRNVLLSWVSNEKIKFTRRKEYGRQMGTFHIEVALWQKYQFQKQPNTGGDLKLFIVKGEERVLEGKDRVARFLFCGSEKANTQEQGLPLFSLYQWQRIWKNVKIYGVGSRRGASEDGQEEMVRKVSGVSVKYGATKATGWEFPERNCLQHYIQPKDPLKWEQKVVTGFLNKRSLINFANCVLVECLGQSYVATINRVRGWRSEAISRCRLL